MNKNGVESPWNFEIENKEVDNILNEENLCLDNENININKILDEFEKSIKINSDYYIPIE